ncbi:hypothetical protein [Roseivirga sp.]|uniref:hypothetical protein n=1 Tax=Roseivirga sp. TaxID=1964215 RepID=UPI003B8C3B43
MRLNKSKSLYVSVLASFLAIAFVDYKESRKDQLTYALHPQKNIDVLVAANQSEFINQKQKLDETTINFDGLTILCQ